MNEKLYFLIILLLCHLKMLTLCGRAYYYKQWIEPIKLIILIIHTFVFVYMQNWEYKKDLLSLKAIELVTQTISTSMLRHTKTW